MGKQKLMSRGFQSGFSLAHSIPKVKKLQKEVHLMRILYNKAKQMRESYPPGLWKEVEDDAGGNPRYAWVANKAYDKALEIIAKLQKDHQFDQPNKRYLIE